MLENLMQIREQGEELWNNLDNKVKILIIGAALISIISLLFITNWASKPNYVTLFNNLAVKDAGAITDRLKEKQINYKLGGDGTKILVPADKVHQVRLDLASAGLPKGGSVGFELFDKTKLGSTDFEQKVNFYRALSGELTRTIKKLKDVEYARVQISAPRESLYLDKAQKAKASVLLKLKSYADLDIKQVEGITHLVASSVEDLEPKNVTVVDTNGNLLSAKLNQKDDPKGTEFNPEQLEVENKFENNLQTALTTMLSQVLGPNNVVVRVNADLNFDKRKVKSETFDPVNGDKGVVRSKQSKEVNYEGSQNDSGGVPGVDSNVPQYKSEEQEGNVNYDKEEVTTNYEINKKVEDYIQAAGDVEKLSVAVMVNKDLSPTQKDSIQQSVAAAIGYDQSRGDKITISSFEFDKSLQEEMAAKIDSEKAATERRWMIIGAVVLLIVIVAGIIIRRMMTTSEVSEMEEESLDVVVDDGMEEQAAAEQEEELSPEEKRRKEMKEEVAQLVREQPDEVARLLKTWLTEE